MRIFFAGLYHETNSFADDLTGLEDFRIDRGAAILRRAGDGSQPAGFLSVAEREGWEIVPAVAYEAAPSGLVDHAVFECFWKDVSAALIEALTGGLDAIYLSLHGAMVTTAEQDPEGELLRRIRATPGAATLPIFGVFDLHATFTPAMATGANGLLGYRQNPHTDSYACAVEAAELMGRSVRDGERASMRLLQLPILWPPSGTGTADQPMRGLEALARNLERESSDLLAINVGPGFAFADSPHAGLALVAIYKRDADAADRALDKLAALAWSTRYDGLSAEADLDELLDVILPVTDGPVLLVEPADNIGGGAPGDCTDILRALIRHDARRAGVILADPLSVERLGDLKPGESCRLALGGRGSRIDLGPVELDVELISLSDGRFELEDHHSHAAGVYGIYIDMGPCAVVRHRGITILLTSHKMPPWDLGQWRSQGIDPVDFDLIAIKAAVAHRRAYDPIARESYTVRTRGPCTSDLGMLPYRHVRRPIFPLDATATYP